MRIQSRQQRSVGSQDDNVCQEGNPLGVRYSGRVNFTTSGISCQFWAASEPHVPKYTDVGKVEDTEPGEHNHCRNPNGEPGGVWCYTIDPDLEWEYCSVPECGNGEMSSPTWESSLQVEFQGNPLFAPKMTKVLDFSADNDHESDNNDKFTSATLNAGVLF